MDGYGCAWNMRVTPAADIASAAAHLARWSTAAPIHLARWRQLALCRVSSRNRGRPERRGRWVAGTRSSRAACASWS